MGRRLPPLSALRAFEAAGRHLSFSRAAGELFVTQSAISRQIRSLEEDLGVLLFRRFNRRIELTEAGSAYLDTLQDCFSRMEDATIRIRSRPSRVQLNLSVLPTLAIRWLVPRLPSFTEAHPDIDVRMSMSAASVDFNREDVDVAIRVGRPGSMAEDAGPEGGTARLRTEALFPDVLVPVCRPALLPGGLPLDRPEALRRHVLLHTTTRKNAWPEWLHALGLDAAAAPDELWFGHFFMTHQAACEGRGIAMLPMIFVADDLASGQLVQAFARPIVSAECYVMLCREHQAASRSIALFRTWLRRQSEEWRDVPARIAAAAAAAPRAQLP